MPYVTRNRIPHILYFETSNRTLSDITEEEDSVEQTRSSPCAMYSENGETQSTTSQMFHSCYGEAQSQIVNSMPNVGVLYSSDLRSPRLDSYKVLSGAQNPGFYPAVYPQEYFIARYPSNNIRNGPNECRVEAKHDLVGMNHTDTQEGSRWYIGASMTPQEGNEWNFFERWRALTAKDKGTTSNISEPEHLDAHQFLSLSGKASGRNSNSKNESEILNDVLKTYQKCIDCAKLENAKSGTKVTEGYCCICEKDLYHDTGTEPSAVLRIYVAPVRTLHLLKCPLKLFEH
ncbi:unnamed protein product [Toxocara canis]|uniref:GATA-type domain-containing protein n=1 Tax=Toxocara canis TaxID=6265 RepID=A0A183UB69_TOXCA|nr:unnamed protein product [Toxocara canis]